GARLWRYIELEVLWPFSVNLLVGNLKKLARQSLGVLANLKNLPRSFSTIGDGAIFFRQSKNLVDGFDGVGHRIHNAAACPHLISLQAVRNPASIICRIIDDQRVCKSPLLCHVGFSSAIQYYNTPGQPGTLPAHKIFATINVTS